MFPKTFIGFLITIILGMAVITALGVKSFYDRAALEDLVHPTAVGYEEYLILPVDLEFNQQLALFGGRPVYAASLEPKALEADELIALTSGMAGEPRIFLRPARDERPEQHYVRIGPKKFLRVHQGPNTPHFTNARPVGG